MLKQRATMKCRPALLLCVSLLSLAACQNWGRQLYIAHDTKLGIDASVNTATSSGTIDLGYDRRFVTWVPRSVDIKDGDDENAKDVMSVLACSELRVGIVSIDYYDESLATGRAAVIFAEGIAEKRKEIAEDYFECFTKPKQGHDAGDSE